MPDATERVLLNLRDFALGANELWDAGLQTLRVMVQTQPHLVEPPAGTKIMLVMSGAQLDEARQVALRADVELPRA